MQINSKQIVPLTIPDGAPIDFANGDVRHFSKEDGLNSVSISNPTRHLAFRDNLLRDKLNEVISVLNNTVQLIQVPVVRTTLPPTIAEPTTNFRIPIGYQVSIVSAIIASFPGGLGELTIWWNPSFGGLVGGVNGVNLVTTSLELTAATDYYGPGELIVQIKNAGNMTGEFVASVLVAMRPVPVT